MDQNTKQGILSKELTLADIGLYIKKYTTIFKLALFKCVIAILLSILLFSTIGYFAKKTSPKEFESECVLYNEQGGGGSSSFQSLASLAGISSGGGADATTGGDLYQLILSNRPFLLELAKTPIYIKDLDSTISLEQYFDKEQEIDIVEKTVKKIIDIPGNIKSFVFKTPKATRTQKPLKLNTNELDSSKASFVNKAFITELTGDDKKIIAILNARIKLKQNGKLSSLLVKMPEAKLSAIVNKLVLELLIKYAIRFKVSKQLENVDFLEARTREAEIKYKESQQKVANFKDNNYNVIFQSVQTQESVLQNNFILYSGIYNQLIAQLEQAKIQLKKDSPLFTVVEPVYIPDQVLTDNSKIISYAIIGLFIGFLISFYFLYRTYKKSTSININS